MIEHTDIRSDYSTYSLSLSKLLGQKIIEVEGTIRNDYGDHVFCAWHLILEDGTILELQGEHDVVYVLPHRGEIENLSDEVLGHIYNTDSNLGG